MRFRLLMMIICAGSLLPRAARADAVKPALDTNAIHAVYVDGDFESATAMLERAIAGKSLRSHWDSTFAFKHLGVMYAAKEQTREKGKYYMLQLLTLEPTALIMDMYASDMIYMIFKNIKDEFEISQRRLLRAQSHVEGNNRAGASRSGEAKSRKLYYWMGGTGLVLVGAGVATWMVMDEESASKKKTYDVD